MWSRHITLVAFLFFGLAGNLNSQAQSPDETVSIDRPSTEVQDPSTTVKLELLEEFERLDRSIRELRSKLDELARAMELSKQEQGKKIADLESRASKIESSGRALRDEKVSFEAEYKTLSKKVEVLEQFLKRNLGDLVSASNITSSNPSGSPKDATESTEENTIQKDHLERFDDVKDFYAYVKAEKFDRGLYRDAIKLFSDIVTQYPDHDLVPNAKYWMALSFHNINPPDKVRALEIASSLIETLPKNHNKYVDSLFLVGQIFYHMSRCNDARSYWERITREFPQVASKAQERIELLNNKSDCVQQ